jgi:hypothetical protein
MQPLDFCNLAGRLIANEKNPEGFRSAISRAYYGAFLHAVAFLERMPVYLVGDNKHLELVRVLSDTGDDAVNEAGAALGDLRDERNFADYKLNRAHVEAEAVARRCLDVALDVIAKLNGCRVSATRFAAVTAHVQGRVARLRGLA